MFSRAPPLARRGIIGYKMKLFRIFGRIEPQKLGLSVLAGCFLVSMMLYTVFKPYIGSSPFPNLRLSLHPSPTMFMADDATISQNQDARSNNETLENKPKCDVSASTIDLCDKENEIETQTNSSILQRQDSNSSQQLDQDTEESRREDQIQKVKPMCNISDPRVDICEMSGDVRIHGMSSSIVFIRSSQMGFQLANESWQIRPYARKGDNSAMGFVKELSLKSSQDEKESPNCTVNHNNTAIVFSVGGYSGNLFHGFTDVIIPLFLTSRQYNREVQFLITDFKPWWIEKHKLILQSLSRYELIDFGKEDRVQCFPHVIVGLRCHKEFSIDPLRSPNGYSMVDFTRFIRTSFSLERDTAIRIGDQLETKPRLLIIARKRTRTFMNLEEIIQMAQELGFEVIIAEANVASDLASFGKIVNSCDVMMGVHGAGLSNSVFLPTNAVVIQVVPWGGLQWIARYDFGDPSLDMKLRYLQYNIKEEESSLIQQYPKDHPVFRSPFSLHKQGWVALRDMFLYKQDVKLDVKRFRSALLDSVELLRQHV